MIWNSKMVKNGQFGARETKHDYQLVSIRRWGIPADYHPVISPLETDYQFRIQNRK